MVFFTGSSDGLCKTTAGLLLSQGHEVVLHAHNQERAHEALKALPKAHHVVIGDQESIAAMRSVAEQVNSLGGLMLSFTMWRSDIGNLDGTKLQMVWRTCSRSTRLRPMF